MTMVHMYVLQGSVPTGHAVPGVSQGEAQKQRMKNFNIGKMFLMLRVCSQVTD